MMSDNQGLGFRADMGSSAATPIAASNIGFQLLKKHGWKEGTGLGISEQGRLEPVQACVKKNKQGLGAEKLNKTPRSKNLEESVSGGKADKLSEKVKPKKISKRVRKMQELEKKIQEKEFERAFFREFWPENV